MINIHTHIFTIDHVPEKFLPWPLKKIADWLVTSKTVRFFKKVKLKGLSKLIYRFYTFKKIGEIGKQKDVFEHLQGFYPEGTQFVTLSMDMAFMGAGKVPHSFESQLDELAELKQKYKKLIHPFVFAHPERKDIFNIVKYNIEERGFAGIKIYPALGYFPNDSKLDAVYEYASKNNIPIITHCTRGGVYYKGKLTKERRTAPGETIPFDKSPNHKFTEVYSDPDRYEPILKEYPNLKLCFAHFGGAGEWDKFLADSWHKESETSWYNKIKSLMYQYKNVYTDISYTLYHEKYYNMLKVTMFNDVIKSRILFGTDYYMQEQETSERAFGLNLRGALGEEMFNQIAVKNNLEFLKTNLT